jgi:hypothetical protein
LGSGWWSGGADLIKVKSISDELAKHHYLTFSNQPASARQPASQAACFLISNVGFHFSVFGIHISVSDVSFLEDLNLSQQGSQLASPGCRKSKN